MSKNLQWGTGETQEERLSQPILEPERPEYETGQPLKLEYQYFEVRNDPLLLIPFQTIKYV
jgi:hypothetical protein